MAKGKVLVVEGLDGSGKQTQTNLLVKRLRDAGHKLIQVSFPNYEKDSSILVKKYLGGEYSNQYGEDDITFIRQMSAFYAVDRVSSFIDQTYEGKSLIQHLNEGTHIICDRYTTSNILHQTGNIKDNSKIYEYMEWISKLEFRYLGLPKPDVVFFLDVEPEISVENIKTRYKGEAKEDILENIEHLRKVYNRKDKVINFCKWERINCCPFEGSLMPINNIHELIIERLKGKFPEFSNC